MTVHWCPNCGIVEDTKILEDPAYIVIAGTPPIAVPAVYNLCCRCDAVTLEGVSDD